MTHLPHDTPLTLFLISLHITSLSVPEIWLPVHLCHNLDHTVLGKLMRRITTREWAALMSVSFPLPLSFGILYLLVIFLKTTTCLSIKGKLSTSLKIEKVSSPLFSFSFSLPPSFFFCSRSDLDVDSHPRLEPLSYKGKKNVVTMISLLYILLHWSSSIPKSRPARSRESLYF